MIRALTYALLCSSLLNAGPARAEVHALLIGVGEYIHLDADLLGPPNDARLMSETLALRGVAPGAMTLLSTGLTSTGLTSLTGAAGLPEGIRTGRPDRAGILAAMAELQEKAAPGDTVFFYFSGHGSQAPDQNGDEGGGYDEILLPMDAAGWDGAAGRVENAFIDDELQSWASALLARGVRLVGVIDACHSATGFRGQGGEAVTGVARSLAPEQLGIPEDSPPVAFTGESSLTGDYVFLYSSQAEERSYEYPLGETGIWHGEFTLRLAGVLASAPGASWAQVLAATSDAMIQGPVRQLPDGEGSMLHSAVFGEGQSNARMRLEAGRLQAGLLQGLREGAVMTLYAEGAGGAPLGEITLGKVTAREALLSGPLPEGAAWAELSAQPPAEPLRLAPPRRQDDGDGYDYTAWEQALAASRAAAGGKADFLPVLTGGAIALAGPDGLLDPEGPGSSLRISAAAGESAETALARALETLAYGRQLQQLLSTAAGRGLTRTEVIAVGTERRPGERREGSCTGKAGKGAPYDPALGVQSCDQLWLSLTNRSGKPQDVSVLYLATDWEVQPIWPGDHMVNRLAPGESVRVGLQIDPFTSPGIEEVWILAVPADKARGPRADLTTLAALPRNRALPQGGESAMTLWLTEQLDPGDDETTTRGFAMKPAELTMIRQILRLKPGAPDSTPPPKGP
ncbi:caspase family protein [Pseudogemmobacter faecipullorum]|uniref:Caspase family protein n=1 Tax=Pseudogemmobacter faecipullorum TaxID=2755041 RepID=A0ABS8CJP7_9RHOB|nr:caspase family protein [Pseudogemmobacter faecipullorum]MCB5409627.1 caspase family protein [Pseudogemmobacter faecipullorum]